MYKYKLTEETRATAFHKDRILAFDVLERKLENIKKLLRQGKLETIKYYYQNPESFAVIKGTDLINDYLKDIETLLKSEE